jgi:hypothetical protein
MDGSSPAGIVMPIMVLAALLTGAAVPFVAASLSGRKPRPPKPGAADAGPVEYLYVPCASISDNGHSAETRRWVQEVPIVKKTATWIYYTSGTWDRRQAVVSPGCIRRQEFETDTRSHRHGYAWEHCSHDAGGCRHGYPAGVIPIPGDRPRSGLAGRLFFATREAAEDDLYRQERERAEQAAREARLIKELRRAMAEAHPDQGGTAEQFIEARRRYETARQ